MPITPHWVLNIILPHVENISLTNFNVTVTIGLIPWNILLT